MAHQRNENYLDMTQIGRDFLFLCVLCVSAVCYFRRRYPMLTHISHNSEPLGVLNESGGRLAQRQHILNMATLCWYVKVRDTGRLATAVCPSP